MPFDITPTKKSTAILIPARLESKRFPNKMLVDVGGIPLITHVYNKCSNLGYDVYVVTDSHLIAQTVPHHIMTGHAENGTERCAQAMQQLDYEKYINVQGDMIDVTPNMIRAAELGLEDYTVSTIYTDMPELQRKNPNTVKMISNAYEAHWFCRASLDYGYHHLGVYGYKKYMGEIYLNLAKYQEEEIEKLEQLRWIQHGIRIGAEYVKSSCMEINTPDDLIKWKSLNEEKI